MLRTHHIVAILLLIAGLLPGVLHAQDTTAAQAPDTVKAGIYITSIHNIDFKEKEFTINLWLWLKYKNRKFDFLQNLEVPSAKTVSRSFATLDTSREEAYLLMKLQCVMKDSWKINNFPFDRQTLRFSIENSQFDSKALVFVPDTLGEHYDKRFLLRGWNIDSLTITAAPRIYETTFGDPNQKVPKVEYSAYKMKLKIDRDAMGLFWKMFLGMYIAFLIAYLCLYIHPESTDSRFGLSVGSLFAVVGNKYIVDSSLPESTTFTLVDSLHGITLAFILVIMIMNAFTLRMVKKGLMHKAKKFDLGAAILLFIVYVGINAWLIYAASHK